MCRHAPWHTRSVVLRSLGRVLRRERQRDLDAHGAACAVVEVRGLEDAREAAHFVVAETRAPRFENVRGHAVLRDLEDEHDAPRERRILLETPLVARAQIRSLLHDDLANALLEVLLRLLDVGAVAGRERVGSRFHGRGRRRCAGRSERERRDRDGSARDTCTLHDYLRMHFPLVHEGFFASSAQVGGFFGGEILEHSFSDHFLHWWSFTLAISLSQSPCSAFGMAPF